MMEPGRQWAVDSSLFGYQGQLKDDEIAGRGNTLTAEFWEYDTRLGRRWNLDSKQNVSVSMYAAFVDNPVLNIDPMGQDTISINGKNGNNIQLIHENFDKSSFNLPLNIDKSTTVNFDQINGGKMPDVIGYSLGISVSGNDAIVGGSAAAFVNFAIFTSGKYEWQPFKYLAGGAQGGVSLASDFAAGDISGSFSVYAAWKEGGINNEPDRWSGGFLDMSANFSAGEGLIGGGTVGYFQSSDLQKTGKGYWGLSVGASVGIGAEAGIPATGSWLGGGSYYLPLEFKTTTTKELLNSTIGRARLALKWKDFQSGGLFPGSTISDGLNMIQGLFKK